MALFGHPTNTDDCPQLGVKRTRRIADIWSDSRRLTPVARTSSALRGRTDITRGRFGEADREMLACLVRAR
jgi:hypothetical protein